MTKSENKNKHIILLNFIEGVRSRISEDSPLIQAILGPRQVGKTTAIEQITSTLNPGQYHYASADAVFRSD